MELVSLVRMFEFSIIIPCFNEEGYILKLLACLERQAFDLECFEVIVVDNHSTDRTSQRLWDYAVQSSLRLKLVHEYTPGVSRARNAGAKVANGRFLIFLDADNLVDKKFLLKLYSKTSVKNYVAGTICTLPDENNVKGWLVFIILEFIKVVFPKPFGKSFVERGIFDQTTGFNESIALGENVEFLQNVKYAVKEVKGRFGHLQPGVRCSLRRFDKEGYLKILLPWFLAYNGIKGMGYKTMAELNEN